MQVFSYKRNRLLSVANHHCERDKQLVRGIKSCRHQETKEIFISEIRKNALEFIDIEKELELINGQICKGVTCIQG